MGGKKATMAEKCKMPGGVGNKYNNTELTSWSLRPEDRPTVRFGVTSTMRLHFSGYFYRPDKT